MSAAAPRVAELRASMATRRTVPSASEMISEEPALDVIDEAEAPTMSFKIVHARPAAQRLPSRPAAAGSKPGRDDIAICRVRPVTVDGRVFVDRADTEDEDVFQISLLSFNLTDPRWMMDHIMRAKDEEKLQYRLQGIELPVLPEPLSTTLEHFVASGAIGVSETACELRSEDADVAFHLRSAGLAKEHTDGGWSLTKRCLKHLRLSSALGPQEPAFAVRGSGFPIKDRTYWEHLQLLAECGWEWRPVPSKAAEKQALQPYHILQMAPKIFYTGLDHPLSYLVCLLEPARILEHGIETIPHAQPNQVYIDLQNGKAFTPRGAKRPRLFLVDRDRGGRQAALPAPCPPGPAPPAAAADDLEENQEEDSLEDTGGECGISLEEWLESILEEEHPSPPASAPPSPVPPPPPAPPPARPPPPLGGEMVAASAVAPIERPGSMRRSGHGEPWGPFSLLYIAAGSGAWQATCPWHKGTSSAPRCKHQEGIRAKDGERGDALAKLRAKAWCIAGARPDIKTKRQHLRFRVAESDLNEEIINEHMRSLPAPPDWDEIVPDGMVEESGRESQRPASAPRAADSSSSGSSSSSSSSDTSSDSSSE